MRQLRACLGTTLGAANRRRSLPPAADGKRLGWALKRLGAAIVFGVIAAPQPASAMCFPYPLPGYLQELEGASCTPVDEDAALQKLKAQGEFPYPGTRETYVGKLLTAPATPAAASP